MKRALLLLVLLPGPALAADRTLTVTDFDRIRVEGGFVVDLVTGKGPSGRVSGSAQGIERTSVEVQDRTLIIRPNTGAWGGWPGADAGPVTIRLTTPMLRSVWVGGSATLTVGRMRSGNVDIVLEGSGRVAVASVEADHIDVGVGGAGSVTVGGKVAQAEAVLRGSGNFDGSALLAQDVRMTAAGTGDARMNASRMANVTSTGTGNITVAGKAACTVSNLGSGTVICGKPLP